jgi:hypothetical protein
MEASFFVNEDALKRGQSDMRFDEAGLLRAFDLNRERICAVAAKVYGRAHKGSYDLLLCELLNVSTQTDAAWSAQRPRFLAARESADRQKYSTDLSKPPPATRLGRRGVAAAFAWRVLQGTAAFGFGGNAASVVVPCRRSSASLSARSSFSSGGT